jgi:hypothetical protein
VGFLWTLQEAQNRKRLTRTTEPDLNQLWVHPGSGSWDRELVTPRMKPSSAVRHWKMENKENKEILSA